jgi:hypothetical protein
MPFTRRLEPVFISELKRLSAEPGSWWDALKHDRGVFISVRSNAINAYAGGASIARIVWSNRLQLRVNRKFLVLPKAAGGDAAYVDLLGPAVSPVEAITVNDARQYLEHLTAIKAVAQRLTGDERSAATQVAASCDCVIDVEAAFDSAAEFDLSDEQGGSAGRVDVIAVNDEGRLVLTEVKLYANPEIRSRTEPAVCAQLVRYHQWARDQGDDIRSAYAQVLGYRRELNLTSSAVRDVTGLDVVPRLLIIGFDSSHLSALDAIKKNIVHGLRGRIPGFRKAHIRGVGSPSNVRNRHLF